MEGSIVKSMYLLQGQLGKVKPAGSFNYYCDMKYLVPYSSFIKLPQEGNIPSFCDEFFSCSDQLNSAHCLNTQIKLKTDLFVESVRRCGKC